MLNSLKLKDFTELYDERSAEFKSEDFLDASFQALVYRKITHLIIGPCCGNEFVSFVKFNKKRVADEISETI